jgi:hypothetical protein
MGYSFYIDFMSVIIYIMNPLIILFIIAVIVVVVIVMYFYNREALTNMEAVTILPIIYDSSVPSKNKITDLLGIPVNDPAYNELLNAPNDDPDNIIASIKQYIGSSLMFVSTKDNTENTPVDNSPITVDSPINALNSPLLASLGTPSSDDLLDTSTPTTPKTFKERALEQSSTK